MLTQHLDTTALPIGDSDEDTEDDPKFVDSDYENDQGDDDLFKKFVDTNVQDDIAASKGKSVVLEDINLDDTSLEMKGLIYLNLQKMKIIILSLNLRIFSL